MVVRLQCPHWTLAAPASRLEEGGGGVLVGWLERNRPVAPPRRGAQGPRHGLRGLVLLWGLFALIPPCPHGQAPPAALQPPSPVQMTAPAHPGGSLMGPPGTILVRSLGFPRFSRHALSVATGLGCEPLTTRCPLKCVPTCEPATSDCRFRPPPVLPPGHWGGCGPRWATQRCCPGGQWRQGVATVPP